jgi:anti-sigma regulatory factor (Ser/Thr protein kinase)
MAIEQWFDAGMLPELRRAVLAEAVAADMPDDRAADVMLAVHELAANAVRHGGGTGRLRMHAAAGELYCQVSDAGLGGAGLGGADGHARAGHATAVQRWLIRPGHGLWLVRDIADQLSIAPGPAGSEVTAVFLLPPPFPGGAGHS